MKFKEIKSSFKLYCDLDGVLSNFDKGVEDALNGVSRDNISNTKLWKTLARTSNFYGNLEWMQDGKILWNYIKKYNPTILSGLPLGNWAARQKDRWVTNNLGKNVPRVFVLTVNKYLESAPGHILIDDREKTKSSWESKGGIFILHTSTEKTINDLKELNL